MLNTKVSGHHVVQLFIENLHLQCLQVNGVLGGSLHQMIPQVGGSTKMHVIGLKRAVLPSKSRGLSALSESKDSQ